MPVSHWAMLPFLLLNIWLLYRIGLRLGGEKWAYWLIPLVLLDPVMAGQSVLISPDVVLVCGFLLVVEGVSGRYKVLTMMGALLLCMISVRGMMTAAALATWWALIGLRVSMFQGFTTKNLAPFLRRFFNFALKHHLPFLPGFVFAGWFLWWHKSATGWIGLHPGSPWAPTFEPATGVDLIRNIFVLGWRWLDFGRVFEWLILGLLLWRFWRVLRPGIVRLEKTESLGALLLLLICLVGFLSPSSILFKNVSAHRYSLPGFMALHFVVYYLIGFLASNTGSLWKNRAPAVLFAVLVTGFALGNLWIYPRGVAMGWDATLAHLPFHRLRSEAVQYLEENGIDFNTVGSTFPNLNTGENTMLNGDQRRFADKDFLQNDYFFASNVFNDITDSDFKTLKNEWVLQKKWQHSGVWIELYKKKQQVHFPD